MNVRISCTCFALIFAVTACGPGTAEESDGTVDEASTAAALTVASVTASADDGNAPANVLDGSYGTRWSAFGKGASLTLDLGATRSIGAVGIAWYRGASRVSTFELSTSTDGQRFSALYSGTSSGRSTRIEKLPVPTTSARFVRLTVEGNTENDWASVTEVRVYSASAPPADAGAVSEPDAGDEPATDAGTPTPHDAGTPAPRDAGTPTHDAGTPTPHDAGTPTPVDAGSGGTASAYEQLILADGPVALWAMSGTASGKETDLTGNGNTGTYKGAPALAAMPNGGKAADFDGVSQYLTVPSRATFSVPTTGKLTFEAWIRPDVLQFPNDTSDGYVDYLGKCADYGPTCEWEARMYGTSTAEGRPSRLSAYIFNSSAGLGSAADWQPSSGVIAAGQWYHVVGEYQTVTQPSGCSGQVGGIDIWVNGVKWNMSYHAPTGCMSQYSVTPAANNSPLNIGTMALDSWFHGAVGEVAIYDYLLTPAQITAHFTEMTGRTPTGSCANACSL